MSIRYLATISLLILTILSVTAVQAISVTTGSVLTNATTDCVTFQGTSTGTGYVWFEYGSSDASDMNPNMTKSFATKKKVAAGTFTDSRCGLPLFPGKSYVVQAAGNTDLTNHSVGYVKGADVAFTFSTSPTPHVTVTYEAQLDTILDSGGIDTPFINGQKILTNDIWVVYIELVGGSIFFGLLVAFIFMNLVIKQRTVVMAFLLTILTGTTLWTFMPDEFIFIAQSMTIIAVSGLIFWLFMKRK